MVRRRPKDFIEFAYDVEASLLEQPIRLRDIRAKMAEVEAFGRGVVLERTSAGQIAELVTYYYPLTELIAYHQKEKEIYYEHARRGDFDLSNEKGVLVSGVYGLACWWLKRQYRYLYGDVRLLRPIIGDVLIQAAGWEKNPEPDYTATLGEWYEALAPGGALYPSDEHIEYAARFEAFAEELIWDSRGREYITIVNFPAPKNAPPPMYWFCTQHELEPPARPLRDR